MIKSKTKRGVHSERWIWIFVVTILILILCFFSSYIISYRTDCLQFGLDEGSKGYRDSISCSIIVFPYRIMSPIVFSPPEPDPELFYPCVTSPESKACKSCMEDGWEGEICRKCDELFQSPKKLNEEQNNYLNTNCIES